MPRGARPSDYVRQRGLPTGLPTGPGPPAPPARAALASIIAIPAHTQAKATRKTKAST